MKQTICDIILTSLRMVKELRIEGETYVRFCCEE
jgi:hypothetical protein